MKIDDYNLAVKGKKGQQCKVVLNTGMVLEGVYLGESTPKAPTGKPEIGLLMRLKLSQECKEGFKECYIGEIDKPGFLVESIVEIVFL